MSGRHVVSYQQLRANFQTGYWSQTLTVNTLSNIGGNNPLPQGFPSGHGMKVCGCWGPNLMPVANEPQCASKKVRVNVCPGLCLMTGHIFQSYKTFLAVS